MAIQNTTLTTTAANIFVNQSSTGTSAITTIHLCNFSNSNVTVNVYAVPAGSTAGNGTVIYASLFLPTTQSYIIDQEKLILGNIGDAIMANCSSANSVTATISSIGI
jgi:hypothetical protein